MKPLSKIAAVIFSVFFVGTFTVLWKFLGSVFEYFTSILPNKLPKKKHLSSIQKLAPTQTLGLTFLERIPKMQNSYLNLLKTAADCYNDGSVNRSCQFVFS